MSNMLHKRVILTRKKCRKCGSRNMYNKAEYGLVCSDCGWRFRGGVNEDRGQYIEDDFDKHAEIQRQGVKKER